MMSVETKKSPALQGRTGPFQRGDVNGKPAAQLIQVDPLCQPQPQHELLEKAAPIADTLKGDVSEAGRLSLIHI